MSEQLVTELTDLERWYRERYAAAPERRPSGFMAPMVIGAIAIAGLYFARPVLEPLGLTHPQYLVMLALWQGPALALKDLATALRLDPGTLSPLVKRLEAQGLVTRRRGSTDERTLAIALTPAGAALRAEAESIPARMMERLGVERDELVVLHRTMSKLIAAAEG